MANVFTLDGSWDSTPASGLTSGDPEVDAVISELLYVRRQVFRRVELGVDSPVSVSFDDLSSAAVIVLKVVGGKVRARMTSTDGSLQAVPVDSLLILMSATVPITALDLTRVSGAGTVTCIVYLAEKQ